MHRGGSAGLLPLPRSTLPNRERIGVPAEIPVLLAFRETRFTAS
jgi:hypothetical protein